MPQGVPQNRRMDNRASPTRIAPTKNYLYALFQEDFFELNPDYALGKSGLNWVIISNA
jgi:hypothetical protein